MQYLILGDVFSHIGELRMQQTTHARRAPLWRRVMTIALLPTIIFLWMTGWILTQIGVRAHPEFEAHRKEFRIPDEYNEDSRIAYEPEIIA